MLVNKPGADLAQASAVGDPRVHTGHLRPGRGPVGRPLRFPAFLPALKDGVSSLKEMR
ncbi:hypothetical protein GCM10012289_66820 [Nonomuraea cavernae]|uniref:Uncharacterized protein n=1 Tax=Nonomuraea cavernae TaxID=2045107 RepID=A0A918DQS3_9ACTN|nr:hypothetical protein GCM10012289_66820 [Nonomuraea cavernae]